MADPEGARKAELHQKVETLCDRIEAGTLGLVQGADFLEKELMAQGKLTQGGHSPWARRVVAPEPGRVRRQRVAGAGAYLHHRPRGLLPDEDEGRAAGAGGTRVP